jgi:hypothetical protein
MPLLSQKSEDIDEFFMQASEKKKSEDINEFFRQASAKSDNKVMRQ